MVVKLPYLFPKQRKMVAGSAASVGFLSMMTRRRKNWYLPVRAEVPWNMCTLNVYVDGNYNVGNSMEGGGRDTCLVVMCAKENLE